MTLDDLISEVHAGELEILKSKGVEYSLGQGVFSNFSRIAHTFNVSQELVLLIYLEKHLDAIKHFVKSGSTKSESIESRIFDARNYLLLLFGMIKDRG